MNGSDAMDTLFSNCLVIKRLVCITNLFFVLAELMRVRRNAFYVTLKALLSPLSNKRLPSESKFEISPPLY